MKELTRKTSAAMHRPEKVIQFGEGNFLRAFVDWILFRMNQTTDFNGGVVAIQPIEQGMAPALNAQDGLYHVNLQGIHEGKAVDSLELIDVITRCLNPYICFDEFMELAQLPTIRFVVSNTTEAGIVFDPSCRLDDAPAKSYPGKLTQLLYRRFNTFNGAADKGWIILPCELIFHNGAELKRCIEKYIELWELGPDFKTWFDTSCAVYSTLVDRIVPGFPADTIGSIRQQLGYNDQLVVKGEIFHLWVIEAPDTLADEFPVDRAGLNVLIVPTEKPYHDRKVTLLNGPHTALSPIGFLCGLDTVGQMMDDPAVSTLLRKVMYDELLPTLDLPRAELEQFARDVLDRFANPFVKHYLASIMLNAFPKYKARLLPGLKEHLRRKGRLPQGLVLGLAAIIVYYKGGMRGDTPIAVNDDPRIMEFVGQLWNRPFDPFGMAHEVLGATFIWDEDLTQIDGLTTALAHALQGVAPNGVCKMNDYLLTL